MEGLWIEQLDPKDNPFNRTFDKKDVTYRTIDYRKPAGQRRKFDEAKDIVIQSSVSASDDDGEEGHNDQDGDLSPFAASVLHKRKKVVDEPPPPPAAAQVEPPPQDVEDIMVEDSPAPILPAPPVETIDPLVTNNNNNNNNTSTKTTEEQEENRKEDQVMEEMNHQVAEPRTSHHADSDTSPQNHSSDNESAMFSTPPSQQTQSKSQFGSNSATATTTKKSASPSEQAGGFDYSFSPKIVQEESPEKDKPMEDKEEEEVEDQQKEEDDKEEVEDKEEEEREANSREQKKRDEEERAENERQVNEREQKKKEDDQKRLEKEESDRVEKERQDKEKEMEQKKRDDEQRRSSIAKSPSSSQTKPTPSPSKKKAAKSSSAEPLETEPSLIKKPKIIFSLLPAKTITDITKIIKDIGGTVSEKTDQCTHLICDEFKGRSAKMLASIALGKMIVTSAWLYDSAKVGHFLAEQVYALHDAKAETEWSFDLSKSLEIARGRPKGELLFSGHSFFVMENSVPPPSFLNDVIKTSGGKILAKIPAATSDNLIVIGGDKDRPSPPSANSSPSSSPGSSPPSSHDACNQSSPPKYSDIDFAKYSKKRKSTLKGLIDLCLSETKKVQSSALRLLWHLSAQAELKVLLFEEGVLEKLKYLMFSDLNVKEDPENRAISIHRTEVQLASSAILQNITEYRFERGEINPNQVKIVNEGIVDLILLPRSKCTDRRVQFLTTLTIANLSMNDENHTILSRSKAFDIVESFVTNNSLHMDLINIKLNHPKVVELAKKIADQLQIEEPSVTVNTTKIGSDLKKLFNNPDFSDICFVCEGKKIYAHKAICASRCEQLRAMFTWGKESKEQEISLPHIPYSSMYGVLEYIYCGVASITWENACDLLQWADFFSLQGLKSRCEFFLWHYIDLDNAPIILSVADSYGCTQLRNVSAKFVIRNWEKIKDSENWIKHVSTDLKKYITERVYTLITCSCGCFCSCLDDSNNDILGLTVQSEDEDLFLGVDESYTIFVSSAGSLSISSPTIYGAIRGLETFSQLIIYDQATNNYTIPYAPISINDYPRFEWRGFLVDTARHYLPVTFLLHIIDTLAYNKFNTFHWHIVDAVSFPFESTTYPDLTKGAFNPLAIYTAADVSEIVAYAKTHGIRWGVGYPELMANCPTYAYNVNNMPLNPALASTYTFLRNFFTEVSSLFTDQYFHSGGDELILGCWLKDPTIVSWMNANKFTTVGAEQYFETQMTSILTSLNRTKIVNGVTLAPGTVIQVWDSATITQQIVSAGFKTLVSYPCEFEDTWLDFYGADPLAGVTKNTQNIIGGEAIMFAEQVNQFSWDTRVWPRALAIAERLWSAQTVTSTTAALPRLGQQSCSISRRGVQSSPLFPDFCLYPDEIPSSQKPLFRLPRELINEINAA
eukprot:gene3808-4390_t